MVNSSVIDYTTNEALPDPFVNQRYVYFILAIIMGVSIALNVMVVVLLTKEKYLRKRSQYLVFSIISVSEIFNDVLYLMLLFLRQYEDYMCMLIILVYSVNRHNVFIHLLYLCVDRVKSEFCQWFSTRFCSRLYIVIVDKCYLLNTRKT